MPRAVLFDIDGTLIDSVDLHTRAWVDAFRHFGFDIGYVDVRVQIGKGSDQLLPTLLPKGEAERRGEEISDFRSEVFKSKYLPLVRGLPGARALLERVKADGGRIALASSAKGDELEAYKRIADIEGMEETSTSSDDADRSKPHPDIFQAALDRLGDVSPRDAVVVGDTPYDVRAASKAGVRTIGVLSGGWSAGQLKEAGCVATYVDVAELLNQYDRSPLAGE